jgi:hypothetical protein
VVAVGLLIVIVVLRSPRGAERPEVIARPDPDEFSAEAA